MLYMYINLLLETLYLLKKTYQNPFRSFKDLSIHRVKKAERSAESDFVLYYVLKHRVTSILSIKQAED